MNDIETINVLSLFLQADIFVKLVMILLVIASVWSWTIIFNKARLFTKYQKETSNFKKHFWNKNTALEDLYKLYSDPKRHEPCPISNTFKIGFAEYSHLASSSSSISKDNIINTVDRAMVSSINKDIDYMEKSLIFLSSVSSAAPFVGLLGTVWGIMNSFTAIASSQQTNLTVVAPGIAEALLATALGLIAAIPANIAYNRFANNVARQASSIENFRNDFLVLLSRSIHKN